MMEMARQKNEMLKLMSTQNTAILKALLSLTEKENNPSSTKDEQTEALLSGVMERQSKDMTKDVTEMLKYNSQLANDVAERTVRPVGGCLDCEYEHALKYHTQRSCRGLSLPNTHGISIRTKCLLCMG